ncbi:MAG: hypothetical protein WC738_04335 [Candidatus Omnitrophota bacterium]|jgi:hypothetical protein
MKIQDITNEIISETGGDSTDTDLYTKMFGFLKAALRRLPRFVLTRTLLSTASVSLSALANSASLPAGFVKERFVYRKDTGGQKIEIKHSNYEEFNKVNNDLTGSIYFYDIVGKTIYFDHKAEAADTIYVECFKNDTSALAGTDDFFGNDDEVETVKDLTKYIYYKDYEEDMEKAAASKQDAASGIATMKSDYLRQQQGYVEEA